MPLLFQTHNTLYGGCMLHFLKQRQLYKALEERMSRDVMLILLLPPGRC
jgi:hypothetical protein